MQREINITLKITINNKEGERMDQNMINELYSKFNIPERQIPNYTNAEEFSKNIKVCSILKDVDVYYSSNSLSHDECHNNQM